MISLNVNGTAYQVNVDSGTPLLWALRDTLGLKGTKYGCGIQQCGACTVLVDGQAQRSCDINVVDAAGRNVTTIEGLSPDSSHPLQKAWIVEQVPQCGYCQSGMIMAAVDLLAQNPHPSDADIADGIDNICACGTYQRIRAAIHRVANGG